MLEHVLHGGVRLRLYEERDADELYALVDSNRAYLAPWMPWASGDTLEQTLEFIRTTRRQVADNTGLETALVIDGRIAGTVGVRDVNWDHRSSEIGYWLAEEHQGRGVMSSAVRAHLDHAFGGLGLNRIELRAATDNVRSRALAERLGFTQEGVLREAETVGGRRHDLVLYAMLAADWRG